MSYLVLARKYRPQSFDDLVGQEHVTKTLANAIAQNRVAHAFLFTGVRGVGKTTSARILAKCLNCLGADPHTPATGPTATPCQTCAACTEIAAGVDLDVQEIDGASYNGVDEVRRLQEGLAFRPARDRFKIYIVDEVHMLSNAAWNAFLKTLEEPPPHVKFIFATTEVHKVPVTILSRCQRYDFKLVGARQIGVRIKEVLGRESIAAEDAAVGVLAREAAGSMRDAMSLLDQVIAFGGEKITAEDVARVLGVADREVLHKLTSAILSGDAATALDVLDAVARQGTDLVHLCRDLLRHVRNLVVAKVCPPDQARALLDLADEEVADVLAVAQKTDVDDLTRLFQGLSRAFDEIVRSGQVRASLEMTVVRLARRPALLPLDELLARLGDLEKRLATGTPPPTRGGGAPSGAGGGRGAAATPVQASSSGSFGGPTSAGAAVAYGTAQAGPTATGPALAHAGAAPSTRPMAGAAARFTVVEGGLALSQSPAAEPEPVQRTAPRPEPVRPPEPIRVVEDAAIAMFRELIDRIKKSRPAVASVLELAAPLVVTRERIVLGFEPDSFAASRAEETDTANVLAAEAKELFGVPTTVSLDLSARTTKVASVAYLDAAKRKAQIAEARAAVENHELVKKAIALFDAELRDIRLPTQED